MMKMYFLTAFRSLLRNKSYSLLNIAGLALGITCSLLLFLVIQYQLSYDTFHSKADRIYRLNVSFTKIDFNTPASHFPLPAYLRSNGNLGFEHITQIYGDVGAQINIPAANGAPARKFLIEENIGFVDAAFFDVFDFDTGPVNVAPYFKDPNVVVLSQTLADKFFPDGDAVGSIIKYNNEYNLKVVSVMPDMPGNTEFPFQLLVSLETVRPSFPTDWGNLSSNHQTFVVLPEKVSAATAEVRLNDFVQQFSTEEKARRSQQYLLQPLNDIHYNPKFYGGFAQTPISREMIVAMAIVGVVLLLTACINFINLATAQAIKRAREVGVRKVLGSSKWQIVFQFLCETFFIVFFASFLSVILSELALPYLNELLDLKISFNLLQDPVLLLFLVVQTLVVTLFAGFYPAFILSSFQPITALKSKVSMQKFGDVSIRQVLVVLQFTICQVLIICTFLVNEQMSYFRNKALGFDKEAVVLVTLPREAGLKIQPLRQELLNNPAIREISFASDAPSSMNNSYGNFYFNHAANDVDFQIQKKFVDMHFFELFDMKFLAGGKYTISDSIHYMVINDTLRRRLGLESPEEAIGKNISLGGGEISGPIAGVVSDFHQGPLQIEIEPLLLTANPGDYTTLSAKIDMGQKQEALKHLEQVWETVYPADVFSYEFLDESIAAFYDEEARQNTLFKIFSIIAIFIGCLGLYGLVAFMAAQRTKEVGIRKVMGASVANIAILFSKEFINLVLIAFVLAVPVSYYLMDLWLQDYTYRIAIEYWPFILAGVATLLIALITMSAKAIQAALANPVLSLKSD
ncbi:FtsX-like permease family protein [Pontibacter akesuensis]|uniref:FtsX-like permease family protein n=1 Tax=Pontibacter akesuensis TaxID=388950 RepID=A0A1I7FR27_9BACT|nr:FtsX-like permease family protein [Pontibacter akesuensis]GHA60965.1 ABC transporter permease [Pontibacter akesuensis]SFU38623.1 FtsX-like permease family protein [Pontibacter akesuensis]